MNGEGKRCIAAVLRRQQCYTILSLAKSPLQLIEPAFEEGFQGGLPFGLPVFQLVFLWQTIALAHQLHSVHPNRTADPLLPASAFFMRRAGLQNPAEMTRRCYGVLQRGARRRRFRQEWRHLARDLHTSEGRHVDGSDEPRSGLALDHEVLRERGCLLPRHRLPPA